MDQDALKRAAALAAIDTLVPGAVVGVGTGSTVNLFIEGLRALRGRIPAAVSSSEASTARLRAIGIPVRELNDVLGAGETVPVYVDGADEIDAGMHMIKGGGGALTREKILAAAAGRFVCIVDRSKCVERLGRFPLPVEVVPMALEYVGQRLRQLGGQPRVRDGFLTDNGNRILDVCGLSIADPCALEQDIDAIAGVVTVGLFARRGADLALVATPDGIRRIGA